MRQSVIDLFKNTVVFNYSLPHGSIEKSIYTTINYDYCYTSNDDSKLAEIIHNALIDYAFNDNEIYGDLNDLQTEAIETRMRIEDDDSDSTQQKYGFFGEVLLNLFLRICFQTTPIIAKGYFYDILKPEEPKGYDSYHLIQTEIGTSLWFGEVKFHQSYSTALKSVFENIEKAISNDYFRDNLLAILPKKNDLNIHDTTIDTVIQYLKKHPKTTIASLISNFNLKLVYPIFIICNSITDYDNTISLIINEIKTNYSGKSLNIGVDYDLFFILMPISNVKQTKTQVLQWIKSKQPLTLL